MGKKIKIIFLVLIAIVLIGSFVYNYALHGGARNLENEKTDIMTTSATISSEFATNTEAANKKYLEKAVAVTGKITASDGKVIVLDKTVFCSFKNQDTSIESGQLVTIKGRVIGYDDLMGELKLDQCFVIKK